MAFHPLGRTASSITAAIVAVCCLSLTTACERVRGESRQGATAAGSWHDDRPRLRHSFKAHDLPAVSKPTYGTAEIVVRPAGAEPHLPDGFSATLVATPRLHKPRV